MVFFFGIFCVANAIVARDGKLSSATCAVWPPINAKQQPSSPVEHMLFFVRMCHDRSKAHSPIRQPCRHLTSFYELCHREQKTLVKTEATKVISFCLPSKKEGVGKVCVPWPIPHADISRSVVFFFVIGFFLSFPFLYFMLSFTRLQNRRTSFDFRGFVSPSTYVSFLVLF